MTFIAILGGTDYLELMWNGFAPMQKVHTWDRYIIDFHHNTMMIVDIIRAGRYSPDLYDLYDLAHHAAGWEPCNLHDPQ